MSELLLRAPPEFCEYANGKCDQSFNDLIINSALFLYPSDPITISQTIEHAVDNLKKHNSEKNWTTWKDLKISSQIIFCEICKAMRHSDLLVTDVTTLNENGTVPRLGTGLDVVAGIGSGCFRLRLNVKLKSDRQDRSVV